MGAVYDNAAAKLERPLLLRQLHQFLHLLGYRQAVWAALDAVAVSIRRILARMNSSEPSPTTDTLRPVRPSVLYSIVMSVFYFIMAVVIVSSSGIIHGEA